MAQTNGTSHVIKSTNLPPGKPGQPYVLSTQDGEIIYIQTEGLPPKQVEGKQLPNMLRGRFETSKNGTVAWLNDVAAIATLRVGEPNTVFIDMWQVSSVLVQS